MEKNLEKSPKMSVRHCHFYTTVISELVESVEGRLGAAVVFSADPGQNRQNQCKHEGGDPTVALPCSPSGVDDIGGMAR
jgi:hypothetical protein